MTPTEQDKLREQIHKLFGDHQADDGGYQSCYDGKWIDMTNEVCAVADYITADRKRVELEARINELEIHQSHDRGLAGSIHMGRKDVDDRIAQLNKQKEQQ